MARKVNYLLLLLVDIRYLFTKCLAEYALVNQYSAAYKDDAVALEYTVTAGFAVEEV